MNSHSFSTLPINAPMVKNLASPGPATGRPAPPSMVTVCIDGGRKSKLRPADILAALTGQGGIAGSEVGRIDIFEFHVYVAIMGQSVAQALDCLGGKRTKGLFFRVCRVG